MKIYVRKEKVEGWCVYPARSSNHDFDFIPIDPVTEGSVVRSKEEAVARFFENIRSRLESSGELEDGYASFHAKIVRQLVDVEDLCEELLASAEVVDVGDLKS